ncbi:hypothetical protein [Paenibacillus zanthoxyli]|uniref:hypothetical protein n=1 Tax=Paenibacillus zanthoxyli TaxID=369399 RepID=UPI00046FD966|nr:hypothetical protein [Paenibacillus zanthoxyli]
MKKSILPLFVLILMVALATACSKANPPQPSSEQQKEWIRKDFITEKVSYYTRQNFRFVEKLAVSSQKNGYIVVLTFIPEVGSAPVKQDIYRSMAAYAFGINSFFRRSKAMNLTYYGMNGPNKRPSIPSSTKPASTIYPTAIMS